MLQKTGLYRAKMNTYNQVQRQVCALFKRFSRENYPFGFTFQVSSKDFIN